VSDKLLAEERKNNNNNNNNNDNNNNNKKRSKHNISPKLRLGDLIMLMAFGMDRKIVL
jgi:hypothetical protein